MHEVPPELATYLDQLMAEFPAIREVWLIGSRANAEGRKPPGPDSDWDFLVFADRDTLEVLRGRSDLHRVDTDFLVVTDGDAFETPWGRRKSGTLTAWKWALRTSCTAVYEGEAEWPEDTDEDANVWTEGEQLEAVRLLCR